MKIPDVLNVSPRTAYGYVRASTDEQLATLKEQEHGIVSMFHSRYSKEGYKLGEIFIDRGISGSIPLGKRPHGHRLVQALEPGDMVILQKIDRGWRSIQDFALNVEQFRIRKIRMAFVNTDIDTGGPAGMMVAQMLAVFAEFERAMISERMKAVHRVKKRDGIIYGKNPYGYIKICRKGGRKAYVPDLATRALVAKLISWREAGWTLRQIEKHCLEQGVKNPYSGKTYTWSCIDYHIRVERRLREREALKAAQEAENAAVLAAEEAAKNSQKDIVNKTA